MRIHFALPIVTSVLISSAAVAAEPYQVLRPGDNDAACEVLSKEINALNAEVLALNQKAERQAKAGRAGLALGKGVFSGLARSASMMGYGGSSSSDALASMLVSNVAASVAQEVASGTAAAPDPATAQPAQITPQQQRLSHITSIFRARPC